jgi:hypothetical protein
MADADRQGLELSIKAGDIDDCFIDALTESLRGIGAEVDGTERSNHRLTVFCYGDDAESMFAAIEPVLGDFAIPKGSTATLRLGSVFDDEVDEFVISVGSGAKRTRRRNPRPRAKLFKVGDWFAVPMFGHGYMVGRVTCAKGPTMIGHYFGPLRSVVPELIEISDLRPSSSFTQLISSDVGLREGGGYINLGGYESFRPERWPNPEFIWVDHLGQRWGVRHDASLTSVYRRLPPWNRRTTPKYGHLLGGVEVKLLRLLVDDGALPVDAIEWAKDAPAEF